MERRPLYVELVPLAEATAAAYHTLYKPTAMRRTTDTIAGVRKELTIALGALAPIYAGDDRHPIDFARLDESIRASTTEVDLDQLYIRRSDLLRAVEALQSGPLPG